MKRIVIISIIGLFLFCQLVCAEPTQEDVFDKYLQYENKMPVRIIDHSDDATGSVLVYKIKELIRTSNSMILTTSNTIERIDIICKTMSYSDLKVSTIYSVIWVYASSDKYVYLDSTFGYVGNQRLDEVSERIIAETDKIIQLIKEWSETTE